MTRGASGTRRRYLAGLSGALLGGIAGCGAGGLLGGDGAGGEPTTPPTGSPSTTEPGDGPTTGAARNATTTLGPDVVTGADGTPAEVCSFDPVPGHIPAVVDPAFAADYDGVEATLAASEPVIGVERDGRARAYPLRATHEIVNDELDVPLLVTYCPLCRSGLVAERRVQGEETLFLGSGILWKPPGFEGRRSIENGTVFGAGYGAGPGAVEPRNDRNLVMFDEATGSFWSQLLARAICGPQTGDTLRLLPSTVTTWAEWRADHPDTDVLLPAPPSGRWRPDGADG